MLTFSFHFSLFNNLSVFPKKSKLTQFILGIYNKNYYKNSRVFLGCYIRPSLNAIMVVLSAYHMVIKFPTENGVGMVRGDQWVARECYLALMKQKAVDNIHMDELDMRDELNTRPMPSEELEPVQLHDQPEHLVYIGSKLAEDVKDLLIRFLKQNVEVFAWKQEDMGGIDPAVITHKLNVAPSFKPVNRKEEFSP